MHQIDKDLQGPYVRAPWTLTGAAWIVPQTHPVDQIRRYVPEALTIVRWRDRTAGGYVCVDYDASPVGPYREIMFVPALVRHGWRFGFLVSHIYVDSAASIAGGRGNWWLPKAYARFELERHDQTTVFRSHTAERLLATGVFTDREAIRVPFTNRRWPLALLQPHTDRVRHSLFRARGRVGLASGVLDVHDATGLPCPSGAVRFPIVSMSQFRLEFMPARTIDG